MSNQSPRFLFWLSCTKWFLHIGQSAVLCSSTGSLRFLASIFDLFASVTRLAIFFNRLASSEFIALRRIMMHLWPQRYDCK